MESKLRSISWIQQAIAGVGKLIDKEMKKEIENRSVDESLTEMYLERWKYGTKTDFYTINTDYTVGYESQRIKERILKLGINCFELDDLSSKCKSYIALMDRLYLIKMYMGGETNTVTSRNVEKYMFGSNPSAELDMLFAEIGGAECKI